MSKPINLQLGWPSKSLFPTKALHEASAATFLDPALAGEALIYGPDPGYQPLRESLGEWLTAFYKPAAGPVRAENIFIGNGASQTLGIILDKFTDPLYTRCVFMIEPTYFHASLIFTDSGFEGRLRGVPEDEEGLDVDFLRQQLEVAEKEASAEVQKTKLDQKYPKLYKYVIYGVPTFSNPSAKVMSLRRRKQLVELARQFDALVVTDDVYDMLRWPVDPSGSVSDLPPPPPRLVDIDCELPGQNEYGNVVSNGSFSKIVAPGARVSWVQGTPQFTEAISTHGATKSGGSPGYLSSVFIDQMLRNGSLDKHIAEVLVPTYRKRYGVLMDAVEKHLIPLGVCVSTGQAYQHEASSTHPSVEEAGGFFTYLTLPDDLQPGGKVAEKALDSYGLKIAHGGMMVAAGDPSSLERAKASFGRGIRLSWSWHNEEDIREGIERLAQVLQDMRSGVNGRWKGNDNTDLDKS